MRFLSILMVAFLVPVTAWAQSSQPVDSGIKIAKKTSDVIPHEDFDALLKKYVDGDGGIDYKGWKASKEDLAALDSYLENIAKATVSGSNDAKLAFYINAYNAIVIRSVIKKYPTSSVMKVKNFFKKKGSTVAGKKMSLDHLENKIIRPEFKEARIHFVLVCGAKSCPKLRPMAATEENVQSLMETAAKEFIPKATTVKGNRVKTSQLFNWFKDDFKAAEGSVAKYLAKYMGKDFPEKPKISFTEYSWKLNKQKKKKAKKVKGEKKEKKEKKEKAEKKAKKK